MIKPLGLGVIWTNSRLKNTYGCYVSRLAWNVCKNVYLQKQELEGKQVTISAILILLYWSLFLVMISVANSLMKFLWMSVRYSVVLVSCSVLGSAEPGLWFSWCLGRVGYPAWEFEGSDPFDVQYLEGVGCPAGGFGRYDLCFACFLEFLGWFA